MKFIFRYLKPHIPLMMIGLLIKIAGTFADLGLPWVLAHILDVVIPTGDINKIYLWGGVMILMAFLSRMFNVKANRMASKVARDTTEQVRHDLFWKINQLSGAQIDSFGIPSLISRMTSDTYNIHQFIGMMQRMGVRAPFILVGGIIITSTMEPALTLVLIAVMPFLAIIVTLISKKGIPLYVKVQEKMDHITRVLRENITGIRIIKALSKTEYEKKRFRDVNEEMVRRELKAAGTMAASSPLMNFILNAGLTLVIIVGAYRVNAGASLPGSIIAFLSYFTMISNSVLAVNRIFINLSKASASANRLEKIVSTENDLHVLEKEDSDPSFHIEFKNVSFRYNKNSEGCLENINFSLKHGETLGIIGPTGCGKTTMINLLMRFYDVDDGAIYVNGKDIRTYRPEEFRKRFGVVFQNDILFEDTVYENINFGRDIPLDKVKKAAYDACADNFIQELGVIEQGTGYEFPVAIKGANLSGGQKQRLVIARALANKSDILILDDASSALDYRTDAKLRQAIRTNHTNSTIITIAQRISSVMSMDHIMVMEEGRILGYGSHKELMETCEVYKDIHHSQMGS